MWYQALNYRNFDRTILPGYSKVFNHVTTEFRSDQNDDLGMQIAQSETDTSIPVRKNRENPLKPYTLFAVGLHQTVESHVSRGQVPDFL